MAVVVVARWQARPGNESALLAGALTLWREFYGSLEPSVFQGIYDPAVVLYIDEWNRPGEYRLRQSAIPARLDALCNAPVQRIYLRQLHETRRASGAAPVVGAAMFHAPPGAVSTTMRYVGEQLAQRIEAAPGCWRRATYQDLDHPGRLLVITGWRSEDERRGTLSSLLQRMDLLLRPMGTVIERFNACTD